MTYSFTVERWKNESTGRPARNWYWEVTEDSGRVVAAGIRASQQDATERAQSELKLQQGIDQQIAAEAAGLLPEERNL